MMDAYPWASAYWSCLEQAQDYMNLTAWKDQETWWRLGVAPCLQFLEHVSPGSSVVDIGSGSGLPGLVIALARPDCRVTLIEPRRKRSVFLRMTAVRLNVSVQVCAVRAQEHSGSFDYIVARAVTDPSQLIAWTEHLAHAQTRWLLHRPQHLHADPRIQYIDYAGL